MDKISHSPTGPLKGNFESRVDLLECNTTTTTMSTFALLVSTFVWRVFRAVCLQIVRSNWVVAAMRAAPKGVACIEWANLIGPLDCVASPLAHTHTHTGAVGFSNADRCLIRSGGGGAAVVCLRARRSSAANPLIWRSGDASTGALRAPRLQLAARAFAAPLGCGLCGGVC